MPSTPGEHRATPLSACATRPVDLRANSNASGAVHFATRIRFGVDPALVSGRTVWAQYWMRDPQASFTTGLSDALAFTIRP